MQPALSTPTNIDDLMEIHRLCSGGSPDVRKNLLEEATEKVGNDLFIKWVANNDSSINNESFYGRKAAQLLCFDYFMRFGNSPDQILDQYSEMRHILFTKAVEWASKLKGGSSRFFILRIKPYSNYSKKPLV